MAEITWTIEAEQWLRDIYEYISRDSPSAAARVVQGIYDKAQLLRDFPEMGYKYRAEPDGDIRILLYGHYRIAYLIKAQGSIDILGVFHGALDMDRRIKRS
jgi:toxin ParE1/3/4